VARTLDVYLHHNLVGHLTQNDGGQMGFEYLESWLQNQSAMPLSQSLPLRKERFTRKECAGFFGGILPEQNKREIVAKNLGISAKNDFAMLEQIGGECAGAVTFMPAGEPLPEREDRYRDLSTKELVDVLKTLPRHPLLAGEEDVRLSLAGAQDKVAVKVTDDKISIPLGGALSTHILKPANERFAGLVFNEGLCLKLARAGGLSAARAETRSIEGIDYILVERYDRSLRRSSDDSENYERLHQEDFCQALGIISEHKYQGEGGPSLKQCFDLLRDVSTAPVIDLQRLLDAVIFNYLIGNHDAHGKNFSIVYDTGAVAGYEARFSPLYDLVCTVYYPELSKKMAMKIGGENLSERISPHHFETLADEAGLAKPLVKQRVPELAASLLEGLKAIEINQPVAVEIAKIIQQRSSEAISKFAK
jgi:serine/threonine-protein kinase HipA